MTRVDRSARILDALKKQWHRSGIGRKAWLAFNVFVVMFFAVLPIEILRKC